MKDLKLFLVPLAIILLLASCNTSDNKLPFVPMASLNLEVSLEDVGIKLEKQGETVTDINYTMDNISSLIFLLHDGKTGEYIQGMNLPKSEFVNFTKEGVTKFSNRLPFGIYNVTLIVTTQTHVDNSSLDAAVESYSKAVCLLPNEHIYYNTYKVDCRAEDEAAVAILEKDVDFDLPAKLNLITGEFIFMISEVDQIPANADFSMSVEVKSVPSAIYIETGVSLNDADATTLKLPKFESKTGIINHNGLQSKMLAKVYTLLNGHLGGAERGTVNFVYKENSKGSVETQNVSYTIAERNAEEIGHWVSLGIYSGSGTIEALQPTVGK